MSDFKLNVSSLIVIISLSLGIVHIHATVDVDFYEYEKRAMPNQTIADEEAFNNIRKVFNFESALDFTNIPNITTQCREDFKHYHDALKLNELWALKMFDASAKLSSGILSGNVNNYGDVDECLSINEEVSSSSYKIQGKHCAIRFQTFIKNSKETPYIAFLHQLTQSFELIKSQLDDPSHIFGQYLSTIFGLCVPSSCTHHDVEISTKYFAAILTKNTGLNIDIRVKEEMCQIDDKNELKFGEIWFIITILFFGLLIFFGFQASKYEGNNQFIKAFSMKDNWEKLFTLNSKSDDIKTIHGIRFINAILIYICHKSTQGLIPTINRTKLSYDSTNPVTILVRICAIYTDAFLCLSGLLVSYSLTKSLNRGNRVSTWREIIARYIRVMPLIISTMLITTFIIPKYAHKRNIHRHLTVDKPSQLCKEFGWRNILMIQNLFNIEEMCNLHTHHVVSDFQLFLIAPFLITLLWKSPKVGVILISGLATISTIARFIVTYVNRLQYFMPFGAILSKCVDTANLLYTKPTHRFTVYGIGLLLGFFLLKFKDYKMSRKVYIIGNVLSFVSIVSMWNFGKLMINLEGNHNRLLHAIFASLGPIMYCLPLGFFIISAQLGFKNRLTKILEWKYFVITTRFCYAFYLIQIPIFQFTFTMIRDIRYYDPVSVFDLNDLTLICICSILMTLFIETPFNNLKEILFNRTRKVIDQNSNLIEEKKIE